MEPYLLAHTKEATHPVTASVPSLPTEDDSPTVPSQHMFLKDLGRLCSFMFSSCVSNDTICCKPILRINFTLGKSSTSTLQVWFELSTDLSARSL